MMNRGMVMLIFSAVIASAQARVPVVPLGIAPGSAELKCVIAPYDNAWLWTVAFPDGTSNVQGIWSDHVDRPTVDGKPVIRRVQGMSYVKGKTMQLISIIDPKSCAPLSTERHAIDGSVYTRVFSVSNITTDRTTANGDHQATTIAADTPVFSFNDGEDALLLASLPLRPGYGVRINSIDEMTASDNLKPIDISMLKRASVHDSRGTTVAFVVEAKDSESKSTLWISKKPPYYLRLEVSYFDNRYRFIFERI
jgi:hypothetical protein